MAKSSQPPNPAAKHANVNLNHHAKLRFMMGCGTDSDMRSNRLLKNAAHLAQLDDRSERG
jgi:hypothetical protein